MSALASRRGGGGGRGRRPGRRGRPAGRVPPPRLLGVAREVAALSLDHSPQQQAIDELAEMVIEITGTPIDERGVAATLESRGLRDVDAVERYAKRDIFDLADEVFVHARALTPGQPTWVAPPETRVLRRSFVLAYLRGGFSFLPLLVQVVLLLTIGYSQWGWVHFTLAQASTVALGVGLAMLGTAGFVQLIGYLGPLFAESDKHRLARRAAYRTLAAGMLGSVALAGVVGAVLLTAGGYPAARLEQALLFDVLVSAVWLLNGALYMVKRQVGILIGIAASVGVVAVVMKATSWGIYAAQWLGLGAAIAVQLALVASVLARRAATTPDVLRSAKFPRPAVMLPALRPLFLYGSAYFGLLLADRAVAWTAGHHPLALWFNVSYELGLDVAMFAGAAGIAFLECSLHAFSKIALPRQDRFSGLATGSHNRWYLGFFARQLAAVMLLLAAGAGIMLGTLIALHSAGALGSAGRYWSDPVTRRVLVFGFAGYAMLALGVASTGVLFNLNRARTAARAALAGAVLDIAVGLVLSRLFGFSYAVLGLTAGAAVFAILAGVAAGRALRRADYSLYAAY
jgi:hypothetical protein